MGPAFEEVKATIPDVVAKSIRRVLAENVYRDFMNLEQFMDPAGVIVIDDVLPNHPLQAARIRQTRAWTGDVWRFAEVLAEMRPDLRLTWLDSFPTGLLLVQGLDLHQQAAHLIRHRCHRTAQPIRLRMN